MLNRRLCSATPCSIFFFAALALGIAASTLLADAPSTAPADDPRQALRQLAGQWTVTIEIWLQGDQPPMTSTVTSDIAMQLGGKFLLERATGAFLGMPTESLTLFGYDDHHQRYDLTSASSLSGATLRSQGVWDATSGHLVFRGEVDDAAGRRSTRTVYQPLGEGFTMTVYEIRDGGETRVLRSTYAKR